MKFKKGDLTLDIRTKCISEIIKIEEYAIQVIWLSASNRVHLYTRSEYEKYKILVTEVVKILYG